MVVAEEKVVVLILECFWVMRTINISWVGHNNFGDELIGYAIRLLLNKYAGIKRLNYYQDVGCPIYIGENDIQTSVLHNEQTFNRVKKLFDNYYLRNVQNVIVGGGSMFMTEYSISWKNYIIDKVLKYNPSACIAAVGVTFGDFADSKAEQLAINFIKKFDYIVTRDKSSAEWASQYISSEHICASSDLALTLPHMASHLFPPKPIKNTHKLALVLSPPKDINSKEQVFKFYAEMTKQARANGIEVSLYAFCCNGKNDDAEFIAELGSKLGVEAHNFSNANIDEMIMHLNGCSHVVSTRFHGIVLAYLLDIPFVSISDHCKSIEFCADIGYAQRFQMSRETENDFSLVEDVFKSLCSQKGLSSLVEIAREVTIDQCCDDYKRAFSKIASHATNRDSSLTSKGDIRA